MNNKNRKHHKKDESSILILSSQVATGIFASSFHGDNNENYTEEELKSHDTEKSWKWR